MHVRLLIADQQQTFAEFRANAFYVLLIVNFIFCYPCINIAQWAGVNLDYLGPEEGNFYRNSEVVEDHLGFRYFGSNEGLLRYDGSNFDLFAHDYLDSSTIGPGSVLNLISGSDSLIWIGLLHGGLNSFNPVTEEFKRHPLPKRETYSITAVSGMLDGDNEDLWLGGHHFQLFNFNKNTHRYTIYTPKWIDPIEHGGRLSITSIIQDVNDENVLWLSVLDYDNPNDSINGHYGLVSFHKKQGEFYKHPDFGIIEFMDETGILYGTHVRRVICKYSTQTGKRTKIPIHVDDKVNYMSRGMIAKGDDYWTISRTHLAIFKENGSLRKVYSQPDDVSNNFLGIIQDNSGIVWIPSAQGVSVFRPDQQNIRYFSLQKFGEPYRIFPGRICFNEADSKIYLSFNSLTNGNRVYRIPANQDQDIDSDFIETPENITGLCYTNRGTLWLVGRNNIYTLAGNKLVVSNKVIKSKDGKIPWIWNLKTNETGWIAGVGSRDFLFFHPDQDTVHVVPFSEFPESRIGQIHDEYWSGINFRNVDNRVMIISGKVHEFDLNTKTIREIKYDNSLNPNRLIILDIVEDRDGSVWMATFEVLGRFNQVGDSLVLVDRLNIEDGMPVGSIHELFIDISNRLWVFTSVGLYGVNIDTREVRYYGTKQGLKDPYIDPRQIAESEDGTIFTVNNNGIIVFHPDSLWNSHTLSSIKTILRQVKLDNEKLHAPDGLVNLEQITVPGGKHALDIEFQGLAFPRANGLEYSYRLNEDETWKEIGKSKVVSFYNLSPGTYKFQVKVGSSTSNNPIRSLLIFIPLPWYLQPLVIAVGFFAFIGLVYTIYYYRVRNIKREADKNTEFNRQLVELELKSLRSQMNPHFMFNSLNSIKDFILNAQPTEGSEYLSDFAHLIRLILENSQKQFISLEEEIETLRLYVELEQLRISQSFTFQIHVNNGLELDETYLPPMLLQPYIENAIWHGLMHKKESGNLSLIFSKEIGYFQCAIDDDGIGRKRAYEIKNSSGNRYKSMGMKITQNRIEMINTLYSTNIQTNIIDKVDENGNAIGTRVEIRIPKINYNSLLSKK